MSYGVKRRGGSQPGLVTIGGSYAGKSRGKWSRFDRSTPGESRITDEQYGVGDLEMEPRTTVTVISSDRHSPDLMGHHHRMGEGVKNGGGVSHETITERGSDEYPIMGIKQTVEVEWTVETAHPHRQDR